MARIATSWASEGAGGLNYCRELASTPDHPDGPSASGRLGGPARSLDLAGVQDFRPRAGCFKVGVSNLSVSGNPVSSTAGRFNEQLR